MKRLFFTIILSLCALGATAQELSVSTNLADYADFGTLNAEVSYGVSRHWSVNVGAKYNPFIFRPDGETLRRCQRSLSTGARYWPWHIFSGWWLSGLVRWQEYSMGGVVSPQTSEGDRFGAGVGVGYTYMLSPKLNLDFGAGVWSGYDAFTVYSCPDCGRKISEGGKIFFLPSDILVSLSYIF